MLESTRELVALLRAPDSGRELLADGDVLRTRDGTETFPLVDGIPVLLPAESPFSVEDYLTRLPLESGIGQRVRGLLTQALPSLSHNLSAATNLARFRDLLHAEIRDPQARVLVVGGSILGEGMHLLVDDPRLGLVETDVAMGPRTEVICDAHTLPFADGVFDGAVCQAVLEHVADPACVVKEIHRVLKPGGLVYSEIPFMQQVHEGAYDFTRFTSNGHRRLFRWFEEIDVGATAGPGMALGWSIRAFLVGFAGDRAAARALVNLVTTLSLFWLKYFDRPLRRSPAALDGASGTYFLGRSHDAPRPDAEIIAGYRGANTGFSARR